MITDEQLIEMFDEALRDVFAKDIEIGRASCRERV